MESMLPTVLGSLAGLLSTASFVPQVLKAVREGDTSAISKRMYIVTVTAFVLWIAYGFVIGALPLIIFNALSLALSGTILFLKLRNDRRAA
jgi:MtN3 and saliva related transmembrane protein